MRSFPSHGRDPQGNDGQDGETGHVGHLGIEKGDKGPHKDGETQEIEKDGFDIVCRHLFWTK